MIIIHLINVMFNSLLFFCKDLACSQRRRWRLLVAR